MDFTVLPERSADAFENMAHDLLLLASSTMPNSIIFRHYRWRGRTITFGYAQSYEWVTREVAGPSAIFCRRPTGGGIVDHAEDWTYSLVIPLGHRILRAPLAGVYGDVHDALKSALAAADVAGGRPAPRFSSARDIDRPREPSMPQGKHRSPSAGALQTLCFAHPVRDDVMSATGDRKVAGAAMKRTRDGLLLQGSVARSLCPESLPWGPFAVLFAGALAEVFGARTTAAGWPDFPAPEEAALVGTLRSDAWLKRR